MTYARAQSVDEVRIAFHRIQCLYTGVLSSKDRFCKSEQASLDAIFRQTTVSMD